MKADILAAQDRLEAVSLMEPLLIGESLLRRGPLTDLAFDLAQKSAGLRRALPEALLPTLADLVRTMNCYYSNLIEGHDTHPVDIERALNSDYSADPRKRDLQIEARAHIDAQRWIDAGGLKGRVLTVAAVAEVHRRFCELLPEDLLWVEDATNEGRIKLLPGIFRTRDVEVGKHVAVSPGAVPRFLARYEQVFSKLGKSETILAAAAAHHRLLWIHPFLDGNGRVARLLSHASMLDTLDTGGIWSIARGLARNVNTYKQHLAACDLGRRNDLDGRGNLSEETLCDLTAFFLSICIDQVSFMEHLMQPDTLRTRILLWGEEEMRLGRLPQKANAILSAVLYRGELPRAEIGELVGTGDRQGRRVTSLLLDRGVLVSSSPKAPLRLAFPAALASRWLPGLFPEEPRAASTAVLSRSVGDV